MRTLEKLKDWYRSLQRGDKFAAGLLALLIYQFSNVMSTLFEYISRHQQTVEEMTQTGVRSLTLVNSYFLIAVLEITAFFMLLRMIFYIRDVFNRGDN